ADGLALMPGIIDSHTHYDAQITWDPYAQPSPAHGVTTAVIGNCGFTIAPCKPDHRDLTMRNLTQVEGMSLDVLRRGIAWDFETFPQYLAQLRRRGSALNVAAYVGHSSVRTFTKGGKTSVPFLESLAADSGRPVMIAALLHNSTNPRGVFDDLDAISAANSRGRELLGQVSCCPLTMDFTLRSPYPVEGLESWKPALGLSGDALGSALASRGFRDRVHS